MVSSLPNKRDAHKKSKGTKDHLLVDKMLMTDAKQRHKNLFMSWVDTKKAYDSVPHDWILFCLESFGVHPKIISCQPFSLYG